jgi:adenosylhomocysteine nucleosidase
MVQPDPLICDDLQNLVVILISADAEWSVVKKHYPDAILQLSPFGEWFDGTMNPQPTLSGQEPIRKLTQIPIKLFQGGWGKISAAASTQYVIDTWKPGLLINLGTCGGFLGQVERFDIFIVNETIVYDIYEKMGDTATHIPHYSTKIDLSWCQQANPPPFPLKRSIMVSGDRDLIPGEILELSHRYGASIGDWESGAIAFIARKNNIPLIVFRGVTDLVGNEEGEAYQNISIFTENTEIVMDLLLTHILRWAVTSFFKNHNSLNYRFNC